MRTIRTVILEKRELRLVEKNGSFIGVIIGQKSGRELLIEGNDADDVWRRLHDEAGKSNPKYFGFDGARARFLQFFANGFRSEAFAREERDYKVSAKRKLDAAAPLTDAIDGAGFGEVVHSIFGATNLLSPFEKTRMTALLRGPDADSFIRAAARFTIGDRTALAEMERILRLHENAKWTVVTYLPFLWAPETEMFLKPEVTKDFAARVGHRFASAYKPGLAIQVYETLLDLAQKTRAEIADLEPHDGIDIQSFIWVIGKYAEEVG